MKESKVIAIIGRPNVGKSTLFNRLVGRTQAITSPIANTTRDRHFGVAKWQGHAWTIIDTAGIIGDETPEHKDMNGPIAEQIEIAIEEADFILCIVDTIDQIQASDRFIVQRLNQEKKPFIVVANKADNVIARREAEQFHRLGIETLIPVSAIHGSGIGDLFEYLAVHMPSNVNEDNTYPRVTIIGRPNVGKSHLINRIVGQKRAVVSPVPGTTRDSIITLVTLPNETKFELIDTAGMQRRGKIKPGTEKYALFRTIQAINLADLIMLVLTIEESPTRGDAHIADYALESGKKLIVVLNKIDLAVVKIDKLPQTKKDRLAVRFLHRFAFLSRLPTHFISAETGEGVPALLKFLSNAIQK